MIASVGAGELLKQHLNLAKAISLRLKRRFHWLDEEELYSYSLFGLVLAAMHWNPRKGSSFRTFACRKAMFLAIDEMRRDKLLTRRGPGVHAEPSGVSPDMVDPKSQDNENRLGLNDLLAHLLSGLRPASRLLLAMYYNDNMTLAQIGDSLGVAQSTVCQRHGALMSYLRKRALLSELPNRTRAADN